MSDTIDVQTEAYGALSKLLANVEAKERLFVADFICKIWHVVEPSVLPVLSAVSVDEREKRLEEIVNKVKGALPRSPQVTNTDGRGKGGRRKRRALRGTEKQEEEQGDSPLLPAPHDSLPSSSASASAFAEKRRSGERNGRHDCDCRVKALHLFPFRGARIIRGHLSLRRATVRVRRPKQIQSESSSSSSSSAPGSSSGPLNGRVETETEMETVEVALNLRSPGWKSLEREAASGLLRGCALCTEALANGEEVLQLVPCSMHRSRMHGSHDPEVVGRLLRRIAFAPAAPLSDDVMDALTRRLELRGEGGGQPGSKQSAASLFMKNPETQKGEGEVEKWFGPPDTLSDALAEKPRVVWTRPRWLQVAATALVGAVAVELFAVPIGIVGGGWTLLSAAFEASPLSYCFRTAGKGTEENESGDEDASEREEDQGDRNTPEEEEEDDSPDVFAWIHRSCLFGLAMEDSEDFM